MAKYWNHISNTLFPLIRSSLVRLSFAIKVNGCDRMDHSIFTKRSKNISRLVKKIILFLFRAGVVGLGLNEYDRSMIECKECIKCMNDNRMAMACLQKKINLKKRIDVFNVFASFWIKSMAFDSVLVEYITRYHSTDLKLWHLIKALNGAE